MAKPLRTILISPLGLCFMLIAAYCLVRGVAAYWQGYAWDEMDWNGDGGTTIGEFFESSEIGRRPVSNAGRPCIEYFRYKDAVPVHLVCD